MERDEDEREIVEEINMRNRDDDSAKGSGGGDVEIGGVRRKVEE